MKILHLTTSKKGGAGLFTLDMERYFNNSGHINDVFSFNDFLSKGFIRFSIVVFYNLLKTLTRVKFKKKIDRKHISPLISIWRLNKIVDLVSKYDVVVIYRFANFLSLNELLKIIETSSKSYIIAVDESLFTPYCTYTFSCEQFKTGCKDCPIVKSQYKKRKIGDVFKKVNSTLKKHDLSKYDVKILTANKEEKQKISQSFWGKSNVKIETTIFPYELYLKEIEFKKIFDKKIDTFEDEIIMTISALSPSKRKGFDIFLNYLTNLESFCEQNKRIVTLNVVTSEFLKIKVKSNFLKIIQHGIMNKLEFEKLLASSHAFLSFSRTDSGPFTLNMCYYLRVLIYSFKVGVVTEISEQVNSVFISDQFNASSMLSLTKELFELDSTTLKSLLTYKINNKWI